MKSKEALLLDYVASLGEQQIELDGKLGEISQQFLQIDEKMESVSSGIQDKLDQELLTIKKLILYEKNENKKKQEELEKLLAGLDETIVKQNQSLLQVVQAAKESVKQDMKVYDERNREHVLHVLDTHLANFQSLFQTLQLHEQLQKKYYNDSKADMEHQLKMHEELIKQLQRDVNTKYERMSKGVTKKFKWTIGLVGTILLLTTFYVFIELGVFHG